MGSTDLGVKHMVNTTTLVGGGMKDARFMAWGSLRWLENHHQVVVVVVYLLRQSSSLPCSSLWRAVGRTDKITKIWRRWDLEDGLVENK